MNKLNKSELKSRGWNNDSIDTLLGKPHLIKNEEELWEKKAILSKEKQLSFKNFTTTEDFYLRQKLFINELDEQTNKGINLVNDLSVEFEDHDCLLKNIKKYNPTKPIIHYVQKNFIPNINTKYTLFTDGCFKSIGSKAFASCAGWILDNNTNKIIIEFTKPVELKESNKKGNCMPDFELIGINEGIKFIELLG